jgi:hypothetical protein
VSNYFSYQFSGAFLNYRSNILEGFGLSWILLLAALVDSGNCLSSQVYGAAVLFIYWIICIPSRIWYYWKLIPISLIGFIKSISLTQLGDATFQTTLFVCGLFVLFAGT